MGFLRRLFGGGNEPTEEPSGASESLLEPEELERIGTEDDLLKNYDVQSGRNYQAMECEQNGNISTAITLYERNVSEEFVGAHPYERLASIYEHRNRPEDALRVMESFITLTRSGCLPRGSQRSADKRLRDFEDRVQRLRGPSTD